MIEYTIERNFNNSQSKLTSFIEHKYVTEKNILQWKECSDAKNNSCVSDWAEESWADALHWAYGDENGHEIHNGGVITKEYIDSRLPIIHMRLAAAGVRLACALEMIFSNESSVNDREEIDLSLQK